MTVTVSARLMVRLRHAETQEAKKEVLKVARVKSWAPAAISLSINSDAAASSCVVLDKERQTQSRRNHSMKFIFFQEKLFNLQSDIGAYFYTQKGPVHLQSY